MFCIRQNEQLEADRQVDHPKTQDASSDCQAHQAGAETNHNFCTNNSWYGDPQALLFSELVPQRVKVVNWYCFIQRVDRKAGKTLSCLNHSRPLMLTPWARSVTLVSAMDQKTKLKTYLGSRNNKALAASFYLPFQLKF